eukprot:648443-Rhodomonas_salina.2
MASLAPRRIQAPAAAATGRAVHQWSCTPPPSANLGQPAHNHPAQPPADWPGHPAKLQPDPANPAKLEIHCAAA